MKTQLEITTVLGRTNLHDLSSNDKHTLLILSSFINPLRDGDLRAWPTNAQLVALTGLSERSIKYSLSTLEERGYLQRITKYDAGANKKNRILIINLDKLTPVSAAQEVKEDAWEDDLDDW